MEEFMDTINECLQLLKSYEQRISSIEDLLKVLAANELLEEINIIKEDCELESILQEYCIMIKYTQIIDEKKMVFLSSEIPWKLNTIKKVKETILLNREDNIIPIFMFDKTYGKQKSSMRKEKISYYIQGRELSIFM